MYMYKVYLPSHIDSVVHLLYIGLTSVVAQHDLTLTCTCISQGVRKKAEV